MNTNSNKSTELQILLIYIIMLFAIFNDILRIPGTELSLFRFMLPVAVILIIMHPLIARKVIVFVAFLLALNLFQYFYFYNYIHPELRVDFSYCLFQAFFISCLIVICALIAILRLLDSGRFANNMLDFLILMGIIMCIITVAHHYLPQFFVDTNIDNINNYSCCVAGLIGLLLVKYRITRNPILWFLIGICIVAIYINDSKISLLGSLLMIGIFLCIFKDCKSNAEFLFFRVIIPMFIIVSIIAALIINPHIHEYQLQSITIAPLKRIFDNDPYPLYNSSVAYRTDSTIIAIHELMHSRLLGLGIGNIEYYLPNVMPGAFIHYKWSFSLHNTWLELLTDGGIVVLLSYAMIILYGIKLFFKRTYITDIEVFRILLIFTLPIWSIGPSGLLSLYYMIIVIGLAFLGRKFVEDEV